MEEKEKFYDAVLTEGARWMALRYQMLKDITGLGLVKPKLNKTTYGFLAIARIYNTYIGNFYIKTNIFTYFYLKFIKKFKFLKLAPKDGVEYIDQKIFLTELVEHFNKPISLIEEIYTYYYEDK